MYRSQRRQQDDRSELIHLYSRTTVQLSRIVPQRSLSGEALRLELAPPSAIVRTGSAHGAKEEVMPAKSKKQQMAAGAALSAKRGERPTSSLKGASRQMVESMSEKQLEEFASTKRRKLPTRRRTSR
jgi:Protein of unknwon function (DUF3008)